MNNFLNLYQYRANSPEGFSATKTAGGHFVQSIAQVPTPEDMMKANEKNQKLDTKYYLVLAQPIPNKKMQTIDTVFERFKCTEQEYRYFQEPKLKEALQGQPVYLSFNDGSWGNDKSNGVWYEYVSNSLIRYDGKPLDTPSLDSKTK